VSFSSQIAVVVPCFNEAATIGTLVPEIKQFIPHVIVVDDGSNDDTARKAGLVGAEVIRSETSGGKGAALRLGWQRALDKGFRFALTMDGDGQHSPKNIPAFIEAGQADIPLVIGNRMPEQHKIPPLRRFVNRWMSKRLSRIAGRDLPDTQCGFRLIDLKVWSGLRLETTHFEIESEVLLAFVAGGYRVQFVPIEVIYRCEQSKIRPFRDSVRWFKWLRNVHRSNAPFGRQAKRDGTTVSTKSATLPEHG
jgi:glycosyltransferase involved in cell wall biosynthesis